MNNETTNTEVNGNEAETAESNEKLLELVKAVYHNGMVALKSQFEHVEGQVLHQPVYGPVFVYQVKDEANDGYVCGFFLRELVAKFQSGNNPAMWMASFFYELMKTKGGKQMQKPPANEDEAKAIIDKILVPHCIEAVREEFAPEQVHAGLDWHKDHGPVFETGFPQFKDGNNVCAVPLHLLLTHYLLNRDPSEILLQGLYKIREEHGVN
ncbi:hypothetical protein FHS18_001770 [Paenibacillus phyllosphaerae]|uniref:Uncharacterized protein n=1 Tax=Paenibacillus phyllosphaerae TaxID=274593 RepID=A0A7W5FM51_9BACL|nr:hypothetical protein [Paenibacillus phyllosphaerae]MBB3109707.1 hypothetical protein [Paenibacillus phyllosphaerae]